MSKESELQLNREQRANWWHGEKQLKGCGRSGERKWTGGVKEVRTAGRVNERKDFEERNGERERKRRAKGGKQKNREMEKLKLL